MSKTSLTATWSDRIAFAFFTLVILVVALSIGKGPLYLDVARTAIVGVAVMVALRINLSRRISFKVWAVSESILLSVIVGAGIVGKSWELVAVACLLFGLYFWGNFPISSRSAHLLKRV